MGYPILWMDEGLWATQFCGGMKKAMGYPILSPGPRP
jgi:hypothetical protein